MYGSERGGCFCGAPDIRVYDAGTTNETRELNWGTTYDVRVTVRNMGDDDASNVTVSLKYTLPWTAPNNWTDAMDDSAGAGQKCERMNVAVPALGSLVLGLAVADGRLDAAEAFRLATLDEAFQESFWGVDAEAAARRSRIAEDVALAGRLIDLARCGA